MFSRYLRRESGFGYVLVLFVALRLMMLMTFPPDNLTLFGDYVYYYDLAAYSDDGYLPFIHYWSEYPPVFPFLSVAVYQVGHLFGGGYHVYVYLLGLLMIGVNGVNLYLFYRLARRLRGEETAERLAWVYGVLFVPLIYTWWHFDALAVLTALLALEWLLDGHNGRSAVAMGVGVLVKLMPALLFPAVVRIRPRRRWLTYGLTVALVIAAAVTPLLLLGGPMARASFLSMLTRGAWQTVWALLDGNLSTGVLGSTAIHFDLHQVPSAATRPYLEVVKLTAFALVYGLLFRRARLRGNPRRVVAFFCLTLVLFFLWSKGWSPQWQTLLFPLLLLSLPLHRSVLFILTLSFVNLAEWPVLLSRGMNEWLYLTVPLRTGLLVLLAADLWKGIRR